MRFVEFSAEIGRVIRQGNGLGLQDALECCLPTLNAVRESVDGVPDYRSDGYASPFRLTRYLTIAALIEQDVQSVFHHAHTLAHVLGPAASHEPPPRRTWCSGLPVRLGSGVRIGWLAEGVCRSDGGRHKVDLEDYHHPAQQAAGVADPRTLST